MTGPPKLKYALATTPNPVQVSNSSADGTAALSVVASNPSVPAPEVESIVFQFSIGPNANNLTNQEVSAFAITMPAGWTNSIEGSAVTFTPSAGVEQVGADGLVFTFEMEINTEPGTTQITVTETDAGGSGTMELAVSKFPRTLAITPLTASPQVLQHPNMSTRLDWSVDGGTGGDGSDCTVTLSYQTATDRGSKTVGTSGPYTTPPLAVSTILTLTIGGTDAQGDSFTNTSSVFVTVGPPLVTSFQTSNGTPNITVNYGDKASLAWETQNATNVILQPVGEQAYKLDTLNTADFEVLTFTSTSYYLSAEYKDGDLNPVTKGYGEPVNVTVAPPEVLDVEVVSDSGGNFVNSTYQLTYKTRSANYVCLTTSPDQELEKTWYPVSEEAITIPTPKTQGVEYTLRAFQLTAVQIEMVRTLGSQAQVETLENAPPISAPLSTTLTFVQPGIHVASHSFPAEGDKQTYTFPLSQPACAYLVCINGFYFKFVQGEDHYIAQLDGTIHEVTATETGDGVTVKVQQHLKDQHDPPHTISSDAFLDVQLIWQDDTTPPVLTTLAAPTSSSKVTMPVPEVEDPVNGPYAFTWQGTQNKISGFNLTTGTPTVSSGNVVSSTGQKFEVDRSQKAYGTGEITWNTLARIANQPGGIEVLSFKACSPSTPQIVSTGRPIQSIIVIPTGFFVSHGSSNENFHSMALSVDVSGTPGQTTFFFTPTMYWHKSQNDGYEGNVDCEVLIIYQVPD